NIDPECLLKNYSIVFQDVNLFNNTIMENIRIGRKDATNEEVIEAAKKANCDEFVSKLPDGYNTYIGENGTELSGGERQRISIARALLKDAPIVLLDEATASLDAENETIVQEAISNATKGKTVIVIAHRMRTIENADKVIVLNEGKVVEEGNPQELINKNGQFTKMVSLQKESASFNI
ncbi:MAG: ATP-binding cassette domain-containing protein, partial [Firmicutes bacterium]|nr:ATP-binding cassette domain-containing protein [Candidatus Onthovivens merdipullorum]